MRFIFKIVRNICGEKLVKMLVASIFTLFPQCFVKFSVQRSLFTFPAFHNHGLIFSKSIEQDQPAHTRSLILLCPPCCYVISFWGVRGLAVERRPRNHFEVLSSIPGSGCQLWDLHWPTHSVRVLDNKM